MSCSTFESGMTVWAEALWMPELIGVARLITLGLARKMAG